jgi:hypothetical protein
MTRWAYADLFVKDGSWRLSEPGNAAVVLDSNLYRALNLAGDRGWELAVAAYLPVSGGFESFILKRPI